MGLLVCRPQSWQPGPGWDSFLGGGGAWGPPVPSVGLEDERHFVDKWPRIPVQQAWET